MKLWSRLLIGAMFVCCIAAARAQSISPTGITVSPSSALPGDSINVTVAVANSSTASDFLGTASFSVVFRNLVTGSTFTVTTAGQISPVGGIVSKAVQDPTTLQRTACTGSFTFTTTVPTQTTQAGG